MVFEVKKNAKGDMIKHKARLVVKGYSQKCGIDYQKVFSLVANFQSMESIISLSTQEWEKISCGCKINFSTRRD